MRKEEHPGHLASEVKAREGEVGSRSPDIEVQTPRLLRAWQVTAFALAIAATAWAAMCFAYLPRVAGLDVQNVLGYRYESTRFNSLPARRIISIEPNSPLLSAGVQVGDLVVDPPRGTLLKGESVRLQIRHDDQFRSVVIRSEQVGQLRGVPELCLGILMLILGSTIVFRRRRDIAALAIACALLLGASMSLLPPFPVGRFATLAALWFNLTFPLAFAALAYSVLTFEGGYRSRARPYLVRILIGICAVFGAWFMMIAVPYLLGWAWISPSLVGIAAEVALLALCVAAVADAWRHSEGERRQRLRWLLVAFSVFLVGFGVGIVFDLGAFGNMARTLLIELIASRTAYAVATITLTYAVLRHRVIEVG
jgi:hypothetical protein